MFATFLLGMLVASAIYEITDLRIVARRPTTAPPISTPAAATRSVSATPVAATASPPPTLPVAAAPTPEAQTNAALRSRLALAEGQLEASEGHESKWPANVAPEYSKDAVAKQLQKFIVDRGLAKIDHLDCEEFPCVAVLQLADNGPDAGQKLHDALREMSNASYQGRVALSISSSRRGQGSAATTVAGVSVAPDDEDVKLRVRHRTNVDMQDGEN
jgi:hypothetical protein